MNILLIGYRGSGKTTLGRMIAAQTWKDFVDSDVEVTRRFDGRSIADIWQTDGEPAFRAAEVEVVQELLARDNHVIALGGGTVMQPDAARAIREATDLKRVYLHAQANVLAQRLSADPETDANRPSLLGDTGVTSHAADLDEITAVLAKREPIYRELADVVFDVSYIDPEPAVAYLTRHHL